MKKNLFSYLVVMLIFSVTSTSAQMFTQTEINLEDSIMLYPQGTFESFVTPPVNSMMPDFQTLTLQGQAVSLQSLTTLASQQGRALVFVYGGLSCPAWRNLMSQVALDLEIQRTEEVLLVHIAPAHEAHASNGYLTPWWGEFDGQPFIPSQIPEENLGLDLPQAWTMGEYLTQTESLTENLEIMFNIPWYSEAVIVLDSPEGDFTQWFKGPAGLIVVDPTDQEVKYSESFLLCGIDGHNNLVTIYDVVDNIVAGIQAVGITTIGVEAPQIRLENYEALFSRPTSGYVSDITGRVVKIFNKSNRVSLHALSTGIYVINLGGISLKFIR